MFTQIARAMSGKWLSSKEQVQLCAAALYQKKAAMGKSEDLINLQYIWQEPQQAKG